MVVRAVAAAVLIAAGLEPAAVAQRRDAAAAQSARAARKNGSIAGRVIHADGVAAEGARVAVYAMREGAPAGIVATATSAYDGRYQVNNLPAGEFAVGVTPQRVRGFGGDSKRLTSPPMETLYPGTTDRLKAEPIEVFDGTATEGIDVWLEPAAQRYSISGRALWPEGAGVERVVIEYGGSGVHQGIWYVDDPGGLFTIDGASRGTYVLLARADSSTGPLMGIAATNVVNDSVHDVRLTLREPGQVEGRLVVEGTAGPDPSTLRLTPVQALLMLSPLYPVADATPDSTGRFTMPHLLGTFTIAVNGLPPGWRVRRVTRGGVTLADHRITVMGGERVTGIEVLVGN